ncbi:MAG: hypothetical protein PHH59_07615 [Methylovulum sp.]|uniref:hypothetical protein n=2 Tax=Methylovulum sp. TaxID=1916980 RepID=UPI0026198515|nr:hypothetical protein [Methylovulum sp.]MDD2723873.1 hypothetical protein [Methylovulum sp.]
MNVVVKIEGRDALPIWVLPFVTGWAFSPDMLIYRLVKPYHDGPAPFPTAFNLDTNNTPSPIPSAQWYEINNLIEKLRNEVKGQPKTEWRKRSIEIIKPLEAYVWLDEFNNWFEWSPEIFTRHGKDEITDEPITEPIELCFNPIMNTEDARYFEAEYNSLPVSNAANGVTKWKEAITNGSPKSEPTEDKGGYPTMSLCNFVETVLVGMYGDSEALPTLYQLIEKCGLVICNKVVEAQTVPADSLLATLREREQQEAGSFGDADFDFWETLQNESRYSVHRDDVAMAYHIAGKPSFPWLSYSSQLIQIPDTVIMPSGFGLPAQLHDFQDALNLDSWTCLEALCWLQGRKVDSCRLHQLPKYYPTETDLIKRAIKAKKLTEDSSTSMQWIEWARNKGWLIPPLLEQCLLSSELKHSNNALPVTESGGDAGAGSQDEKITDWQNDPNLLKLQKQQKAILEVIELKEFKPMKIPDGEKGTIEIICKADYPLLFDKESSFSTAWKKGLKLDLFKMANHASFAKRGKQ